MVSSYSAITRSSTGSILKIGKSTFVAETGETLHTGVTYPEGLGSLSEKYLKISSSTVTEMTAGEKTAVDVLEATTKALESQGALQINCSYANEAALPAVPDQDWIVVGVVSTRNSRPGLAIGIGSEWFIVDTLINIP